MKEYGAEIRGGRRRGRVVSPGLYLHIPFCSAICPYCDFAVLTGGPERRARFTRAPASRRSGCGRPIRSRGSTRSTSAAARLPRSAPEQLARILESPARPGGRLDLPRSQSRGRHPRERPRLAGSRRPDALAGHPIVRCRSPRLPRPPPLSRAGPAERRARPRRPGSIRSPLDLIYGLPGQTAEDWRRTLETAVALQPDHISCYQLTIHEGTPFGFRLDRGKMAEAPEETQADLFLLTHPFLRGRRLARLRGLELRPLAGAPVAAQPEVLGPHALSGSRPVRPLLLTAAAAGGTSGRSSLTRPGSIRRAPDRRQRGADRRGSRPRSADARVPHRRRDRPRALRQRYGDELPRRIERLTRQGLLRVRRQPACPHPGRARVADSLARDFDVSRS